MNRQMYRWISQLVRDKPAQETQYPISSTGRQVLERYGRGYINNSRLVFSAEDKRSLRQAVQDELGLDPFMVEQLPGDRLEMAKFHHDEKLADKPVSDDYLLLNSPSGMLCLNGERIQLHTAAVPSAGLLCLNSGIRSVDTDAVVIVENLAMMPVCSELQLPPLARRALWVYRGDGQSGAKVNTCHDFVERLGADLAVIVFSDMDPKGLEIALTMPFVNYWLGPERDGWPALLKSRQASRIGYDVQADAMGYLLRSLASNALSEPFTELISVMRDERSSFRQEHVYSHKARLALFPIREKDD